MTGQRPRMVGLRPLDWPDVYRNDLPAGTRFVKDGPQPNDPIYQVVLPDRGVIGTVTRHTRATPVYRNKRGRSSTGGGTYVEWSWEAACGHLSSRESGWGLHGETMPRHYHSREMAALLLVAEVARHDCGAER